jgi:hypothetical protein
MVTKVTWRGPQGSGQESATLRIRSGLPVIWSEAMDCSEVHPTSPVDCSFPSASEVACRLERSTEKRLPVASDPEPSVGFHSRLWVANRQDSQTTRCADVEGTSPKCYGSLIEHLCNVFLQP